MDPFETQSSQPESNNFDNDFEKLDPFGVPGDDDQLVSSSIQRDTPEEDLYSGSPAMNASEAEPLVSFDDPTPVAPAPQPVAQPDSSVPKFQEEFVEEPPAPAPVKKAEKPAAPSAPSASSTCCSAGAWLKSIDPRVLDLIYWRDVKKSGVVFGSMMVLLLSLAMFSVLSVVAYLSLALLTITICFRTYKSILGAVQKSGDGHPFQQHLDCDLALPAEKVHELADVVMAHLSSTMKEVRRLFLVEDVVDSLKFGLLLWVLTYIGAWFNGMTLIILGVIGVFTLPKVYETYKVQIDQYVDLVKTNVGNVVSQIKEKIPFPKKKSE